MKSAVMAGSVAMSAACLLVVMFAAADKPPATKPAVGQSALKPDTALPEYNPDGALLRPVGYEKWVVVGTSIGLGYEDGVKADPKNPGQFNNVYLPAAAFDHFVATGEFPEQTMFVVTNLPSHSTQQDKDKHNVLRSGFFAGSTVGLEVSIKDSRRFPEGWGYFLFHDQPGGKQATRDAEPPLAKKACFDCHAEHAAIDHVFTQYYSVLTAARERQLAARKSP